MDGELGRIAAQQHGFFYRWQALDCGYRPKEVAALLREKEWQPIRTGAYAPREVLADLDEAGRHVLTVRAVVGNLKGLVVVTHHSALAVMKVPLWGVDLAEVHVHREEGHSARRSAGVVHHRGELSDAEIIEIDGLLVSIPERSVLDAARTLTFEAGVVLADGASHRLAFDADRAKAILERQRDWAGSGNAARVLLFADARAETVGESRSRVLFARIGLPAPTLQQRFYRANGSLLAVCDFYFEAHATIGEFDGKKKYGRALYEQQQRSADIDLGDVVWREKRREDQLREPGREVARVVWSELDGHDHVVRARFQSAFDRAARRRRAS